MRHLLTTIIVGAIAAVAFTMLEGKCSSSILDYSDTLKTESTDVESINTGNNMNSDSESDSVPVKSQGEPLAESGNVKVYVDFCWDDDGHIYYDDVIAKEQTCLFRYVDDKPKDSMILVGPYMRLLGSGNQCCIVVGVDTVSINIKRPFSKTLDLRFRDALSGCKFYRLSRHYALNDSAWKTDFQINIAMRDSTPLFFKDFISEMIRDDVASFFDEYKDDEYITPYIPMIRMRNRTVEQMMEHYYYQFRKLYDKEFKPEPGSYERAYGQHYSYQYYAYPVWQNSDSTLATWKFYNFSYMGGAHGGEREYYLTFDNETGRILGASDFLSKREIRKATETLGRQLNIYHGNDPDGDICYYAWLDDDSNIIAAHDKTINERIDGKVYPRPAITKQGIVFSYQTYEKGAYWDRILHFTQPFKRDFHLKK